MCCCNYYFLCPLARSRRLKIKQLQLDIALIRFECARKRDCICLLDGNGKTLKEVNGIGLEWITRDSCCASANFLGQLNGLSIPRTRSLNNKWYENVSGRKIGCLIDYYYYETCCDYRQIQYGHAEEEASDHLECSDKHLYALSVTEQC